jgi:hypothetical protein
MKSCFILFCNVYFNFRKFSILVWLDLKLYCKRYKRRKETEKNKRKKKKKERKKRIPDQSSPSAQPSRLNQSNRNGTPLYFLPTAYWWTPLVRVFFFPQPPLSFSLPGNRRPWSPLPLTSSEPQRFPYRCPPQLPFPLSTLSPSS